MSLESENCCHNPSLFLSLQPAMDPEQKRRKTATDPEEKKYRYYVTFVGVGEEQIELDDVKRFGVDAEPPTWMTQASYTVDIPEDGVLRAKPALFAAELGSDGDGFAPARVKATLLSEGHPIPFGADHVSILYFWFE